MPGMRIPNGAALRDDQPVRSGERNRVALINQAARTTEAVFSTPAYKAAGPLRP